MNDEPPIVLGQQFATAKMAEEERLARDPVGPTPLGALWRYNQWAGELDLRDPKRQRVDGKVKELAGLYAAGNANARATMRSRLNMDDLYTLIVFAKRFAVFALRSRQSQDVMDGLTAMAMIELRRVDPRDVIWAMGLLWCAAERIGLKAQPLFESGVEMAEPAMAEQLRSFIDRGGKELRAWGYVVVEGAEGPGLIQSGYDHYKPRCALGTIAADIAKLVEKKQYRSDVMIATQMPKVWLSRIDNQALGEAMGDVNACAIVSGHLRPEASAQYQWQHFMIILLETGNEETAILLERLAREKREKAMDVAMVGVRKHCVFALVIGRSAKAGVKAFETPASIVRFEGGIRNIFNTHLNDVEERW